MQMIYDWVLFEKAFPYNTVSPLSDTFRVYGKIKTCKDIPVSFNKNDIEYIEDGEILSTSIVKVLFENGYLFFVTKNNHHFMIGNIDKEYEKEFDDQIDDMLDYLKSNNRYEKVWSVPYIKFNQEFADGIKETIDWYDGYISFITHYNDKIFYFVMVDIEENKRVYKGFEINTELEKTILNWDYSNDKNLYDNIEKNLNANDIIVSCYTTW